VAHIQVLFDYKCLAFWPSVSRVLHGIVPRVSSGCEAQTVCSGPPAASASRTLNHERLVEGSRIQSDRVMADDAEPGTMRHATAAL
jgi:hypothetical protein